MNRLRTVIQKSAKYAQIWNKEMKNSVKCKQIRLNELKQKINTKINKLRADACSIPISSVLFFSMLHQLNMSQINYILKSFGEQDDGT